MSKLAVVTGAGSGVGRAVVHRLAREGWNVALIGRSSASLEETIKLGSAATVLRAYPCDIGDERAMSEIASRITSDMGNPSALVNCAGTNIPRRSLDVLSTEDFDALMQTNVHGAFYFVRA